MGCPGSIVTPPWQIATVCARSTRTRYTTVSTTRSLSIPSCSTRDKSNRARLQEKESQTRWIPRTQSRWRHDDHGPHKEYFQTPGQVPRPDLSPYNRTETPLDLSSTTSSRFPGQPIDRPSPSPPQAAQIPPSKPKSDSIPRRAVRSIAWAVLFGYLGLVAGTTLITWEYLSPVTEEGSEEEAELLEDIKERVDEHPLVESLREDGWKEVDLDPASNPGVIRATPSGVTKGRSMLYQTLSGSKGLVGMKVFHHASEEYSVLVFFTGFGIEGWPDVIHGGIITSMLEEGVQKHVEYFYGTNGGLGRKGETTVNVDFKVPVQSGEVYAVFVPPASRHGIQSSVGMSFGSRIGHGTDKLHIMPLLMRIGAAPVVIVTQNGPAVEYQIQIPSSEALVHAVAQVTMKVASQFSGNSVLDSVGQANASIVGGKRDEKGE